MKEYEDKVQVELADVSSLAEFEQVSTLHPGAVVKGGFGRLTRRETNVQLEFVQTEIGPLIRSTDRELPPELSGFDDGLDWRGFRAFLSMPEQPWKCTLTVTITKPTGERGEFFCYSEEGLRLLPGEIRRIGREPTGPPPRITIRTPLANSTASGEGIALTPLLSTEFPSATRRYLVPELVPPETEQAISALQLAVLFSWRLGHDGGPVLSLFDARRLSEFVQAQRLMIVVGRQVLPLFEWSPTNGVDAALALMSKQEEMLVDQASIRLQADVEALKKAGLESIRDLQKVKSEILGALNTDLFKIASATLVAVLGLPYTPIANFRESLWIALAVGGIFLLGASMKSWSMTNDFVRLYKIQESVAWKTAARDLPEIRREIISRARDLRGSFFRTLVVGLGANAIPVAITVALLVVDHQLSPAERIPGSLLGAAAVAAAVLVTLFVKPWSQGEVQDTRAQD